MTTKLVRHGKSSQGLLKHKLAMFDDNSRLMGRNEDIARVYLGQPLRSVCKNCQAALDSAPRFASHGIDYLLCPHCGHLNGAHEETEAFCDFLYTRDGGMSYAKAYTSQSRDEYSARTHDIYLPKAAFLADALAHQGVDFRACSVADIGAGSGYFVAALLNHGFSRVSGHEVSADQVVLGNCMIEGSPLQRFSASATRQTLEGLHANVVSLIGVLEHLLSPREALEAISGNRNIEYLYLSLPLFSPSVAIEAAFPGVFNRHLGGAHTHLYTDKSIRHFSAEFGFESVAEWRFGLDMTDLFRSLFVTLSQNAATAALGDFVAGTLGRNVDVLQQQLDAAGCSSEVHMLLRKLAR